MKHRMLGNYLRAHRRKSGLSLREVAVLLGYTDEGQVSRHERSETMPPLSVALAYEAIFRTPISTLFPGTYLDVKEATERRLAELEKSLHQRSAKDSGAGAVAHKLTWLKQRREV